MLVDGEPIDGAPVASDSLGIVEFSVDEGGLPPGGFTVTGERLRRWPRHLRARGDDITPTAAVVRWDTDLPATSQVEYGRAPGYGSLSPWTAIL